MYLSSFSTYTCTIKDTRKRKNVHMYIHIHTEKLCESLDANATYLSRSSGCNPSKSPLESAFLFLSSFLFRVFPVTLLSLSLSFSYSFQPALLLPRSLISRTMALALFDSAWPWAMNSKRSIRGRGWNWKRNLKRERELRGGKKLWFNVAEWQGMRSYEIRRIVRGSSVDLIEL